MFTVVGINKEPTEEDINNFIKDFDHDKNGEISWADFIHGENSLNFFRHTIPDNQLPENIIMPVDMIFQKYDKDSNGTLDYKELTKCLQDVFDSLGVNEQATIEDVKEFFKDYDVNHDGKIDRKDFLKVYAINFSGLRK